MKFSNHLAYFFGKGIMNNIDVGDVVTNIRRANALSEDMWELYWLNILTFNLYGDPSLSLLGHK